MLSKLLPNLLGTEKPCKVSFYTFVDHKPSLLYCYHCVCHHYSIHFSLLHVFDCNCVYNLHNRKRLDATLQDMEEKQNSKKEAVCVRPCYVHLKWSLLMPELFTWSLTFDQVVVIYPWYLKNLLETDAKFIRTVLPGFTHVCLVNRTVTTRTIKYLG